jgi:hypothetical protein
LPLCELSLRTRCLYVCACVRACLPVCVCVRVCAQDMIDATGASQRHHSLDCESGCVATAGIGGEGVLLRVRVRVVVWAPASNGLRLWCFRLCFRLCFTHATIAPCASRCSKVPATARLLLAPQASPHGAAGEPRKNPCYYALKPSRTPSSWARFSVVFSRSGDLSFPIFTEPTTMDSKWQDRACPILDRSSGRSKGGRGLFWGCSWCWRLVGRVSGAYPPTCVLRCPPPLLAAALRALLVAAGSVAATVATA